MMTEDFNNEWQSAFVGRTLRIVTTCERTEDSGKCFFCSAPIIAGSILNRVQYHDDVNHGDACTDCASADVHTLRDHLHAQVAQLRQMESRFEPNEYATHLEMVSGVLIDRGQA